MASDAGGSGPDAIDDDDDRAHPDVDGDEDLGEFRGVVLNDAGPVRTVSQPPPAPAQPPTEP